MQHIYSPRQPLKVTNAMLLFEGEELSSHVGALGSTGGYLPGGHTLRNRGRGKPEKFLNMREGAKRYQVNNQLKARELVKMTSRLTSNMPASPSRMDNETSYKSIAN